MTSENQDISSAKRTIDKEVETLRIMEDELGNNDNLSQALDLMQNTKGRVIVTGMGKSGHIGHKIAATLASTGTPAFFVHPGEASHGDLGMLTNDDVVLAISNGGESKELSDIIVYCKRYGIPLIAMTKNPDSSLGRAGDILLKLPDHGEACPLGLAPTSSTTATLVLGDILAVCLLERKGFSKLDYKQRHPGGKLGAILQKVSDLMHTGKEMPLINKDATMKEALLEMTAKMLGSVGIVDTDGKLIGMITDGDLRRCMSDNILSKNVTEIMTKTPKTTTPDILASELLKILNDNKITQMFVIDNGMPVGIIHIHDCFNAGVA
ncbi:MAG: SIS domain-containing protein [Alphaproteobacteria bacterium]